MPENQPPPLPIEDLPPSAPRQAGLGVRSLAFIMDFLLVFSFCLFLLMKILLPQYYSDGLYEVSEVFRVYTEQALEAERNGTEPPAVPNILENERIMEMHAYGHGIIMLVTWCYFGLLEGFLRGSTLGKRTFRLRSINLETGQACSFLESALRGATKTIALLVVYPFLWINFLVPLFNQNRRAGHDYISRTMVVAE